MSFLEPDKPEDGEFSQSNPDKVDVPSFDVCAHKLYLYLVTDIEATLTCDQSPFDWRLKKPDPYPSVGCTRHDGVETLSNPRFEQ